MFTREQLKNSLSKLDTISEKINALLSEGEFETISESELFEKLGVSEEEFMSMMCSYREGLVFRQEVSEEELALATGGEKKNPRYTWDICSESHGWRIDDPSFPSCNNTVEDGSWCMSSDACYGDAIVYANMQSCSKAWR